MSAQTQPNQKAQLVNEKNVEGIQNRMVREEKKDFAQKRTAIPLLLRMSQRSDGIR